MRRILVSCACLTALVLPVATAAGAQPRAKPGFLVVRRGVGDGGVNGRPVVKVVIVKGFVIGRISPGREAQVDIYHLPGGPGPQAKGPDLRRTSVHWTPASSSQRFVGTRYSGSGFRFRAIGGSYRVVVRGSGVYLFAGGQGQITVRGSSFQPPGVYSVDGGRFRSLPKLALTRKIGQG